MNRRRHLTWVAVWGGIGIGVLGCSQPNTYQPSPPPPVTIAKPVAKDITLYLDENGETEAVERAVVSTRVEGVLEQLLFEPGSEVKEGDLLAVIEKNQYLADRDAAQAALAASNAQRLGAEAATHVAKTDLASAVVELERAESEFRREDRLLSENATSRSEWETAKTMRDQARATRDGLQAKIDIAAADLEMAKASVKRAEADLANAKLNLQYTEVKAPIDGRITRTAVKRGNLVSNGTELATIVKNDPIYALFNISERHLLQLGRSSKDNQEKRDLSTVKVFLKRAGDQGYPFEGHLDYVDPEVDQDTGTLTIRAIFDNTDRAILPGFFVRVRVPIGKVEGAMLVPEVAVSRDPVGAFLLVVNDQGIVERKNVVLGPKQDDLVAIKSGIEASDSVIVAGLQRARPGEKVEVQEKPAAVPASANSDEPSAA